MSFAIYGTGGFGREVAPLLVSGQLDLGTSSIDCVFVDDSPEAPTECNGLPVINFEQLSLGAHSLRKVIVAIGSGRIRKKVEERCISAGIEITSFTASSARILHGVEIGPGSVLCDFTTITSNVRIGRSFQGNIYSYVAHDCVIGDYVTFAPRVGCNGNVNIGDFVYVGTGAMFIQGTLDEPLTIGEGAVIGMGSVVTKPVAPYTVVAGNPARLIRTLDRPE